MKALSWLMCLARVLARRIKSMSLPFLLRLQLTALLPSGPTLLSGGPTLLPSGPARRPASMARPTIVMNAATEDALAGVHAPKVTLAPASETDERGVVALSSFSPMDVVATIPHGLVLTTPAGEGWASRLTEQALACRADRSERALTTRRRLASWRYAGWSTAAEERISPDERARFHKDWRSSAGLLTTGSDNDVEIYRKFGLPTHPAIDRAAIWLGMLTGVSTPTARDAIEARGFAFRACRDRLLPLVDLDDLDSLEAADDVLLGGSMRERRERVVASVFSRVVARAEFLDDGSQVAVVPLHERLAHCGAEDGGGNVRLVCGDPRGGSGSEGDVLLVATRAIAEGEALTRDFSNVPRVEPRPKLTAQRTGCRKRAPDGEDATAMLLLLQSGVGF